jgi:hypothetical protein
MNTGGAPKREELSLKKYRKVFYANQRENNLLKKHDLTSSSKIMTYLLNSFNSKTIIINTDKDPKYINELNKIGVNLNQISKKYNSVGEISSLDIQKLNNIIDVLDEKIQSILK